MGIIANYLYRGIALPALYFRLTNITLIGKEWSAQAWGFKDRASSIGSGILGPAFALSVTTPYVDGEDPYPALYAALHANPDITSAVDVLVDLPAVVQP